ncbi:MAG: hypothetical protein JF606_19030 [Burkholderiales bacterium]|nr:hypothetical protein [Burkholderiales bacterium]
MESFARAVEIVLKDGTTRDAAGYRPDAATWYAAAQASGYIQARRAISQEILAAAA